MRHHLSTTFRVAITLALFVTTGALRLQEASAQIVCVSAVNKVVRGKVVTKLTTKTRSRTCLTGEVAALTGPTGATGALGATGPTGATGADGQLRIYGDGSGGTAAVSSSQTLSDASSMFTDVVIDSGVTLTVPSGTVIRCTGTFTNNGTISVDLGAGGGRNTGIDSTTMMSAHAVPHPGISLRAATSGEVGDVSALRSGGFGGTALSLFQASLLRYPGPLAGGGGAGGFSTTGGRGGGSLVVLCNGAVTNNGTISAVAESISSGAAGGGGGVIILASKTSVTSSATSFILAQGGDGGSSTTATAPSGGGGGGVIHIMAPTTNVGSATISVAGGSAGAIATSVSSDPRVGGPGGGASGGAGGGGGSLSANSNTPSAGVAGSSGHFIVTNVDPTSLF
jgi:hypothetical protein